MSPSAGPSRRGLLAAAASAAGAALLTGCGEAARRSHPPVPTRKPTPAEARHDVPILTRALTMERRTVAAYTAGIPLLAPADAVWAKRFLAEELQHVGQVIKLLHLTGTPIPGEAPSFDIGHPHDGDGVLALLAGLEAEQAESWLRWVAQLSPGTMRARAASIVANDAQHLIALRRARGAPALGTAFVSGRAGAA